MVKELGPAFVELSRRQFKQGREKIQHCLDQLDDRELWWRATPDGNSVGNMLLHLAGNVRQWVIDGVNGGPGSRDRPGEFAADQVPRKEVLATFEQTLEETDRILARLLEQIDEFGTEILLTGRRIQGFDETILSAIYECAAHFRGHVQEIVYVTRLQRKGDYKFHWKPDSPEQGAP